MDSSAKAFRETSHLYASNAPFIESWYEAWLDDPGAVPAAWAKEFERLKSEGGGASSPGETGHLALQEKFLQL